MMKKAFSLVELSIVLIIIGLLVAGVSTGSKLIKNAKLQKFITELQGTKNSVNIFKITYDALPGDFSEASSFWSGASDGNNNNIIDANERDKAWSHLASSEIYLAPTPPSLGVVPTDTYPEINKRIIYIETAFGGYFVAERHTLQIGTDVNTNSKAFVPRDVYLVDKKIDDGLPKAGDVTFRIYNDSTDASCTNTSTSYYLSSSDTGCIMVYAWD